MLFRVRLQYAVHVEAPDKSTAFAKAVKALREQPGIHIAAVEPAAKPKGSPSLLMRIIKGV